MCAEHIIIHICLLVATEAAVNVPDILLLSIGLDIFNTSHLSSNNRAFVVSVDMVQD